MASYFLDSSGLVKRYVAEVGTAWVSSLMDPATGNLLYVARVTGVEVVSALTRRARGGSLSATHAAAAVRRSGDTERSPVECRPGSARG